MSRLYLVDDHAMVREGLRALLEDAGHAVVGEASAPTEALADVSRLEPDVVLLDVTLGDRSGFELLAEMQRRKLPPRVIVLTMSGQPRDIADALRLGALGYVFKGSPSTDLLHAVDEVAQGRRYLGQSEAERVLRGYVEPGDLLDSLSPRERQILVMVARGASSAHIGERLHLSPKTVETYRSRLMAKLRLSDVPSLVRWAIRQGLIGVDEE